MAKTERNDGWVTIDETLNELAVSHAPLHLRNGAFGRRGGERLRSCDKSIKWPLHRPCAERSVADLWITKGYSRLRVEKLGARIDRPEWIVERGPRWRRRG
jgi:hypothetical protein